MDRLDSVNREYWRINNPSIFKWSCCGKTGQWLGCRTTNVHANGGERSEYDDLRYRGLQCHIKNWNPETVTVPLQTVHVVDLTVDDESDPSCATEGPSLSSPLPGVANARPGTPSTPASTPAGSPCEIPGCQREHEFGHVRDFESTKSDSPFGTPGNYPNHCHVCVRCGDEYFGNRKGYTTKTQLCEYHDGKLEPEPGYSYQDFDESVLTDAGKVKYADRLVWSCCGRAGETAGCREYDEHSIDVEDATEHMRIGLEIPWSFE